MAVTEKPIILVDSTDGAASDSAASGAGPATALTGTAASTDVGGTVVTLDGSPDLSGVATDGSHVIYLATGSGRRFAAINAVDNTAKTVTVEQAYTGSLSGLSWAIGGVRATVFGTESFRILQSSGDGSGGWTVQMQSGHTESISSTKVLGIGSGIVPYQTALMLEGKPDAATMPVITATHNGIAIDGSATSSQRIALRFFEMKNTNATKTASIAIDLERYRHRIEGVKIADPTDNFWRGIVLPNTGTVGDKTSWIIGCEIAHCASNGIFSQQGGTTYVGNWIHDNGSSGIGCSRDDNSFFFNLITNNAGSGIADTVGAYGIDDGHFIGNTIHGNTSHGIALGVGTPAAFLNNLITNNGGYGITGTGALFFSGYNAFYSNTSGDINSTVSTVNDTTRVTLTADPYIDAANDDYTLNTTAGGGAACRDAGFPLTMPDDGRA